MSMTKEELTQIEPSIYDLVENHVLFSALVLVASEEIRIAHENSVIAVRKSAFADAHMAVGQADGIRLFLEALQNVTAGYRKRKISATNS